MKLGIVNLAKPARLHIDVDDTDLSGVLVQGEGSEYRVIAMVGRELQVTEVKCSLIERLALAAAWCVKKLNRYTAFLASGPGLQIIYPHAAEVACLSLSDLPLRLQARLLELSSYGCTFAFGEGAWAVSGAVARLARETPSTDPTPELHTWPHEDFIISKPQKSNTIPVDIADTSLICHFDGGYKKSVGAGGFLLWGPDGHCMGGKGLCYADA